MSQQLDPITDRNEVTMMLNGANASMVFMCAAGEKPRLVYSSDEFLGGRGGRYQLRDFIFRFDDAQPQRDSWKYNDRIAQPYSTKATVAFVTKMIGSRKLVVRAERYDGRLIDSSFDLTGSPEAFRQAFGLCGIR